MNPTIYTPLQCSTQEFAEVLRGCPGIVKVVEAIGAGMDRFLVVCTPSAIQTHPDVCVRKTTPDLSLLRGSMSRSGGEPLVPLLLFVMLDKNSKPVLLVGEGGLRLLTLNSLNTQETTAIVMSTWRTPADAARGTVDLNSARYAMSDADIMHVLARGLLKVKDVADLTGRSESTVRRFDTICRHSYMVDAVGLDFIGHTMAAKLIEACNNNGQKLEALETSFCEVLREVRASVEKWKARLRDGKAKKKRFDTETQKRIQFSFYGKNIRWEDWMELLEADQIEQRDGKWRVVFPEGDHAKAILAVVFEENPKARAVKFAFRNVENRDYADLALDDLQLLLENWATVENDIRHALQHRQLSDGVVDDRPKQSVYPEK